MNALLSTLCDHPCLCCDQDQAEAFDGRLCSRCADEVPGVLTRLRFAGISAVTGGWSLGPYAGPAGALVRSGKYGGDEGALRRLGEELGSRIPAFALSVDGVVPAPTSPGRSFWRGFDAVQLLARPVARALEVPLFPVLRRWGGAPQASLDREQRLRNLKGRIRTAQPIPAGARLLLVDDVHTTGATAESCADALLGAGAAEVWLLVVCAA